MRLLAHFAVATVAILFATPLIAQRSAKPAAKPPFDIAAETLAKGFTPDDAEVVFRELSPPKKNEFETTAQYEARAGKPQIKPLYAFAVEQTHARVSYRYDADMQQFAADVISQSCVRLGSGDDCSSWALPLKTVVSEREYQGSNAFGATRTVTDSKEETYALWLGSKADFPGPKANGDPFIRLHIKMSPDEARAAKPDLAMLVVVEGRANGDFLLSTGHWVLKPTFSDPASGSGNDYYLHLRPKSIWVYNKKTGRIYQKFDYFTR